jgi:predicted amidophosphoribosyltransferase
MFHPGTLTPYTPMMPICEVCRGEYQRVAAFCPNCGAPLTALAARMREAQHRPITRPDEAVVLPDLEGAETEE